MHICFVAPQAYPVFAGTTEHPLIGGAEVQQYLLAREFLRAGYQVSLIAYDFGQAEGESLGGVSVFKTHAPAAGLPVLRFIHPRLTQLWQAMRRAGSDVYYQRAAGAMTAWVAAF